MQGLVGHTSRSMEHSGTKRNIDYDLLAQEVSEKHISKFYRDSYCYILVKNMSTLCPFSKISLRVNYRTLT